MAASSSLSEADAAKSHPSNLPQDIPDFNSLHELPSSYTWTNLNDDQYPSLDPSSSDSAVPVIDLAGPDAPQLIGHACRTWGAFQVTNHGVPDKVVDDIEFAVRSLFCLPTQQKLKAARSPDGISGYGFHRLHQLQKLTWSESFTIAGSPLEQFRQLWPHDYTKFCYIFEEYEKEMKRLSERLILLMLNSLGLSKADAKWAGPKGEVEDASNNALQLIQLNSYPACPDPDRAMGLFQHTDPSIFNIIHQSNTSGLQVLKEGTGWLTIPPTPGALVVNLGDLIQLLTNGLYPNVIHRAMVNRTQHRFSIAYLYSPPDSAQIAPLPKLVGPSHPPLYSPITWKEYLGMRAKLKGNALPSLRRSAPPNYST